MKRSIEIANLLYESTRGTLSPEGSAQLEAWLQESPANRELMDRLRQSHFSMEKMDVYEQANPQQAWKRLAAALELTGDAKVIPMNPDMEETSKLSGQQSVRQSFISRRLWRYAAAVLLPVLLGTVGYWMYRPATDSLAGIDQLIVPGEQRAVLTLADGSQVALDQAAVQQTIDQSIAAVQVQSQSLSYAANETPASVEALIYNELTTPAGGTFTVTLADGSRAILNAGSRLQYPVAFGADERKVFLTGEAYFDVTHTGAPFIVATDDQEVHVLGTQFNVSAYHKSAVYTTLVEGSVRVETPTQQQLLKPGEQAVLSVSEGVLAMRSVQTSNYTSWIQGKIQFNNETLEEVMERLARWYDFSFQFEQSAHRQLHFTGRISNQQPISEVLKMLEITTNVHFRLEDRMIIIH